MILRLYKTLFRGTPSEKWPYCLLVTQIKSRSSQITMTWIPEWFDITAELV
jgi:hypothetical protein